MKRYNVSVVGLGSTKQHLHPHMYISSFRQNVAICTSSVPPATSASTPSGVVMVRRTVLMAVTKLSAKIYW